MSSATLKINFAFADATAKSFEMGSFDLEDSAIGTFKTRVKNIFATDTETGRKFTNFEEVIKSENGAALTGIKSASITVSQVTRIYDAATYGG